MSFIAQYYKPHSMDWIYVHSKFELAIRKTSKHLESQRGGSWLEYPMYKCCKLGGK